jgi:serine/threonine protein kinase
MKLPSDRRGRDGRGLQGHRHEPERAVALKVLPASVAADTERLARFEREAEVLAALNHPNIAAIYSLERSEATTALVMELVEGDTCLCGLRRSVQRA